jgi:hypothetical protein
MTSSSGAELIDSSGATGPSYAHLTNGTNGHVPPPADTGPVVESPSPPTAAVPPAPAPSPVASGPRLGRREKWVDLPAKTEDGEDAYPSFRIKLWLNYPQHWDQDMLGVNFRPQPDHAGVTLQELRAWSDEREASQREAYGRVVLEHNGWLDFEGNPLPQPQDPTFWELIPTELAAVIVNLQKQASAELPNSIMRRPRR